MNKIEATPSPTTPTPMVEPPAWVKNLESLDVLIEKMMNAWEKLYNLLDVEFSKEAVKKFEDNLKYKKLPEAMTLSDLVGTRWKVGVKDTLSQLCRCLLEQYCPPDFSNPANKKFWLSGMHKESILECGPSDFSPEKEKLVKELFFKYCADKLFIDCASKIYLHTEASIVFESKENGLLPIDIQSRLRMELEAQELQPQKNSIWKNKGSSDSFEFLYSELYNCTGRSFVVQKNGALTKLSKDRRNTNKLRLTVKHSTVIENNIKQYRENTTNKFTFLWELDLRRIAAGQPLPSEEEANELYQQYLANTEQRALDLKKQKEEQAYATAQALLEEEEQAKEKELSKKQVKNPFPSKKSFHKKQTQVTKEPAAPPQPIKEKTPVAPSSEEETSAEGWELVARKSKQPSSPQKGSSICQDIVNQLNAQIDRGEYPVYPRIARWDHATPAKVATFRSTHCTKNYQNLTLQESKELLRDHQLSALAFLGNNPFIYNQLTFTTTTGGGKATEGLLAKRLIPGEPDTICFISLARNVEEELFYHIYSQPLPNQKLSSKKKDHYENNRSWLWQYTANTAQTEIEANQKESEPAEVPLPKKTKQTLAAYRYSLDQDPMTGKNTLLLQVSSFPEKNKKDPTIVKYLLLESLRK